jgi:hypothetical protein
VFAYGSQSMYSTKLLAYVFKTILEAESQLTSQEALPVLPKPSSSGLFHRISLPSAALIQI